MKLGVTVKLAQSYKYSHKSKSESKTENKLLKNVIQLGSGSDEWSFDNNGSQSVLDPFNSESFRLSELLLIDIIPFHVGLHIPKFSHLHAGTLNGFYNIIYIHIYVPLYIKYVYIYIWLTKRSSIACVLNRQRLQRHYGNRVSIKMQILELLVAQQFNLVYNWANIK